MVRVGEAVWGDSPFSGGALAKDDEAHGMPRLSTACRGSARHMPRLVSRYQPRLPAIISRQAAALLFGTGAYVFVRFYRGSARAERAGRPRLLLLGPLGLVGGLVDATGARALSSARWGAGVAGVSGATKPMRVGFVDAAENARTHHE